MDEIRCPHCGKEITGMDRMMLEVTMDNDNNEMVDWASPCPHCGKTIYKKDMDKARDLSKKDK